MHDIYKGDDPISNNQVNVDVAPVIYVHNNYLDRGATGCCLPTSSTVGRDERRIGLRCKNKKLMAFLI